MSAETDIAAIDDGGANTASEVRTALTSILDQTYNAEADVVPASPSAYDDEFDGDLTAWSEEDDGSVTPTWALTSTIPHLTGLVPAVAGDKLFALLTSLPGSGDWTFTTKCLAHNGVHVSYMVGAGLVLGESDASNKAAVLWTRPWAAQCTTGNTKSIRATVPGRVRNIHQSPHGGNTPCI